MTIKVLDDIFQYLGILLLFLNVILYTKSHNRYKAIMAYKFILIYLIISLISSVSTEYLYTKKEPNIYITHLFFTSQFILLSLFYLELFKKKQKKLVKIIFIITLILLATQYLDPKNLIEYNVLEIFITSLPLILYSIIHLYNSLVKKGKFMYINAGILIYLSSSSLIFFLGNYLKKIDQDVANNIWLLLKVMYAFYLI
ncbi:MAG: hypothetical protein ACI9Y7_001439, partial [Dokdonia sp.]